MSEKKECQETEEAKGEVLAPRLHPAAASDDERAASLDESEVETEEKVWIEPPTLKLGSVIWDDDRPAFGGKPHSVLSDWRKDDKGSDTEQLPDITALEPEKVQELIEGIEEPGGDDADFRRDLHEATLGLAKAVAFLRKYGVEC